MFSIRKVLQTVFPPSRCMTQIVAVFCGSLRGGRTSTLLSGLVGNVRRRPQFLMTSPLILSYSLSHNPAILIHLSDVFVVCRSWKWGSKMSPSVNLFGEDWRVAALLQYYNNSSATHQLNNFPDTVCSTCCVFKSFQLRWGVLIFHGYLVSHSKGVVRFNVLRKLKRLWHSVALSDDAVLLMNGWRVRHIRHSTLSELVILPMVTCATRGFAGRMNFSRASWMSTVQMLHAALCYIRYFLVWWVVIWKTTFEEPDERPTLSLALIADEDCTFCWPLMLEWNTCGSSSRSCRLEMGVRLKKCKLPSTTLNASSIRAACLPSNSFERIVILTANHICSSLA